MVKQDPFEGDREAQLVEEHGEQECQTHGLEHCDWVAADVLKVEVSVQVFMDQSVPFPGVFIEVGSVPEVLVELSISETGHFRVEIGEKVEKDEETGEIGDQNGNVEGWEDLERSYAVEE